MMRRNASSNRGQPLPIRQPTTNQGQTQPRRPPPRIQPAEVQQEIERIRTLMADLATVAGVDIKQVLDNIVAPNNLPPGKTFCGIVIYALPPIALSGHFAGKKSTHVLLADNNDAVLPVQLIYDANDAYMNDALGSSVFIGCSLTVVNGCTQHIHGYQLLKLTPFLRALPNSSAPNSVHADQAEEADYMIQVVMPHLASLTVIQNAANKQFLKDAEEAVNTFRTASTETQVSSALHQLRALVQRCNGLSTNLLSSPFVTPAAADPKLLTPEVFKIQRLNDLASYLEANAEFPDFVHGLFRTQGSVRPHGLDSHVVMIQDETGVDMPLFILGDHKVPAIAADPLYPCGVTLANDERWYLVPVTPYATDAGIGLSVQRSQLPETPRITQELIQQLLDAGRSDSLIDTTGTERQDNRISCQIPCPLSTIDDVHEYLGSGARFVTIKGMAVGASHKRYANGQRYADNKHPFEAITPTPNYKNPEHTLFCNELLIAPVGEPTTATMLMGARIAHPAMCMLAGISCRSGVATASHIHGQPTPAMSDTRATTFMLTFLFSPGTFTLKCSRVKNSYARIPSTEFYNWEVVHFTPLEQATVEAGQDD